MKLPKKKSKVQIILKGSWGDVLDKHELAVKDPSNIASELIDFLLQGKIILQAGDTLDFKEVED